MAATDENTLTQKHVRKSKITTALIVENDFNREQKRQYRCHLLMPFFNDSENLSII
jgi:hypothetical protein